jgi:hypothetical protein
MRCAARIAGNPVPLGEAQPCGCKPAGAYGRPLRGNGSHCKTTKPLTLELELEGARISVEDRETNLTGAISVRPNLASEKSSRKRDTGCCSEFGACRHSRNHSPDSTLTLIRAGNQHDDVLMKSRQQPRDFFLISRRITSPPVPPAFHGSRSANCSY